MRRLTNRLAWTLVGALAATMMLAAPRAYADPARSPNARKLVVIDLSRDEKEHAEILYEVRRAVEAHQNDKGLLDYDVRGVHGPLNAGGEVQDQQNGATAKGLVDAGRAAMKAKDYDDATDQFLSALKLLESSYGVLEGDDQDLLGTVLVNLGAARLAAGDQPGADRMFRRAAVTKVDASPLDDVAKRAFAAAEAAVQSVPLGAVQVNTDPVYAEIYVDGRYKGISPKAVAGLTEGPHIITVYKTGFTRPTVTVDVSSTKMVHEELKLEPARRALLLNELKPKIANELAAAQGATPTGGQGVKELGDLFRAETSLIVRVDGPPETKTLELYLFHSETQRLVSVKKVENLDWSFRNRQALEAAVADLFKLNWTEVLGGEVSDGQGGGSTSVFEEWWFWTLVGVAVAGGTTAAILLTQDSTSPPPFSKDGTGAMVLRF